MIELDNVIMTDDIKEKFFVCDLNKCKGACCVEGDLGAPLEAHELELLANAYPEVESYLSEEGKKAIEQQGKYILDEDYSTPTVGGKECAYAIYDEKGILKCGIEEAYNDKKIEFKKPISCHLYPIRSKKYDEFEALNYDEWDICSPACDLGQQLSLPVYKFLKDALVRKYGEDWYQRLTQLIEGE